jgi:hypothetical protein
MGWTSPSVMLIEIAADGMKDRDPKMVESQRRELDAFGVQRARDLGASALSKDFCLGYELGLEVARTYLKMNPVAAKTGVVL